MSRILIADDEPGIRSFIAEVLQDAGHEVTAAADGQEAAQLLARRAYHLLITDLKMPGLDGLALLERAAAEAPEMPVVVLTAHGTVQTAVRAMKLGAFDYLGKPLSGPEELELLVERALEHRRLRDDRQRRARDEESDPEFVATGPAMRPVVEQLRMVAPTDATVLLLGESGTGKEVAARAVHRWSARAEGPFIAVNCAVMSETLLESELFGHEKGAFTGAVAQRRGRVELAEGGTLFLDEIGEMKPELQARLLRVLQERSFERVGGTRSIQADVRWIAATNRDLGAELRAGRFREDLYHRLAVFPVTLPPLRERPEDLLALAEHLLKRAATRLGRPSLALAPGCAAKLTRYDWPGNVRELGNALERAAILAGSGAVEPRHLLLGLPGYSEPAPPAATLLDAEREAIRRALREEDGNRRRTAARLGISERSLYDKLKAHGLH